MSIRKNRWILSIAAVAMGLPMAAMLSGNSLNRAIDANGNYFIQDFETNIPLSEPTEETAVVVEGQGEWLFKSAWVSTNSSYVVSGAQNLRLKKNGSYIVTPVLDKGVKQISFNCKRKGKGIDISVSTDAGKSWTSVGTCSDAIVYTLDVNDSQANRVKIGNNGGGDADIDDLIVSASAFGIEAKVSTGDATNITKNTAELSGTMTDPGDQPTQELGVVWSTKENPTVGDSKEKAESVKETSFTLSIEGLKASTTYHYRAYAVSNAGTVYGEDKTFQTAAATPAVVETTEVTKSGKRYLGGGTVTDDGGADLQEVGVLYAETDGAGENALKAVATSTKATFRVELPLEAGKTYYYRAYAVTAVQTSLGEEKSITIDETVPDTPDTAEKIWCAPDGDDATADGSEARPFYSVEKAIALAEPGVKICMKAGTYEYDHRININDINGTADNYIWLTAVPYNGSDRAVLDFSKMPYHAHSNNPQQGVRLTSSYWHFFKIDICNASDNGLLIERNKPTGGSASDIAARTQDAHDNIIEQCNFYKNGDTGLQMKNLAAYNLVINCDSYLNCDEDEGDADGFAPKLSVGDGNYFYGCRAWANSDDGWDVFYKKEGGFGDNMSIVLENCISYKNGFLDLQTIAPKGNGNGFKCGSDQGAMNVYMNRCLAIHNKAKGFDQNHNAGDIILNNCTGMTLKELCGEKSYSYRIYEDIASGHEVRLTNSIAINDNDATDKRDKATGLPKPGENGKQGLYGRWEIDETLQGMTITTCEFQKADPTQFINTTNDEQLIAPRDEDGELPIFAFAHLKEGSFLIDKGTKVASTEYRGLQVNGIDFGGEAPDLGAYEYDEITETAIRRISEQSDNRQMRLVQTQGGVVLLTVSGASRGETLSAELYSLDGRLLGRHQFVGGTTAIRLPQTAQGPVVFRVKGQNYNASAKAVVR